MRGVQNRLWEEAQQHQQNNQQQDDRQFTQGHSRQCFRGDFAFCFTKVRAMQHRQRVHGSEHQTEGRNNRNHRYGFIAAEQNHKFANEVTGTRHPEGRDRKEHRQRRQPLDFAPQTAHLTHIARMQALVQLAAKDKQAGSGQAVGNHLNHRALVSQLAAGIDSNQHKAHVGNGGVSNQTLDIVLAEGHPRAVENTDDAQPHGDRGKFGGSVREQRQRKAQQAVGRGFQQNPREVNGTGGRRLRVRVRQPAVQRNHRHFYRESDKEAQH